MTTKAIKKPAATTAAKPMKTVKRLNGEIAAYVAHPGIDFTTRVVGGHTRMYPTKIYRVESSIYGKGVLVYMTEDGWAGVKLADEAQIDEYPGEHWKKRST